jgi:hypothetical protein
MKGGIVEPEEMAVVRQWMDKHMSMALATHATIQELSEAVFSMQSEPRLHSEGHREKLANHGWKLRSRASSEMVASQ